LDYRGVVVQNSIPLLNEIHAMHVLKKNHPGRLEQIFSGIFAELDS
jgi:hypothetical protein